MKLRNAPTPGAFLYNGASPSLVERCVWFECSSPRKWPLARFFPPVALLPNLLPTLCGRGAWIRKAMRSGELWDPRPSARCHPRRNVLNSKRLPPWRRHSSFRNLAMSSSLSSRSLLGECGEVSTVRQDSGQQSSRVAGCFRADRSTASAPGGCRIGQQKLLRRNRGAPKMGMQYAELRFSRSKAWAVRRCTWRRG